MRKSSCSCVFLPLAVVVFCQQTQAQRFSYEEPYITAINTELQNSLGFNFGVRKVVVVDSVSGKDLANLTMNDFCFVEDPYGTLHGCTLFAAGPEDDERVNENGMIGVFKNGSIIWHSDTVMSGEIVEFAGAQDLNRDGTVDIMVVWTTANFDGEGFATMDIYSWDGNQGTSIVDTTGENGGIGGNAYGLEIVDLDGDGIMEIRDRKVADGSMVYSWNGQKYGRWPTTRTRRSTSSPRR